MGPLALLYLVGGPVCAICFLCYATKSFEGDFGTPAASPLLPFPKHRETV